ncbi:hypothetical protein LSH36_561g02071 [Paralvinella palmiformis]|uniref:EF-hand domain-containing protein n=1 Tax=Paralvinella palmiformis TaxID=53620 RepID=A0AAD9MVT9_9ANNE|nr:hypothetical protein LSH36_561g02071 [Paralvinella palmiformis]
MSAYSTILTGFIHKIPSRFQKREISDAERKTISSVFYECDLGHKGYLDKEDVKMAVLSLFGYKPSKVEVNQLFQDHSKLIGDSCQGIQLENFTGAMTCKLLVQDEDDLIRQTFLVFDSQCRGFLTLDDLKKAFAQVAPHLSLSVIESAFREVDRDGDGRVSYKDFEFMMKYNDEDKL